LPLFLAVSRREGFVGRQRNALAVMIRIEHHLLSSFYPLNLSDHTRKLRATLARMKAFLGYVSGTCNLCSLTEISEDTYRDDCNTRRYNLVVIGAGPAGLVAARGVQHSTRKSHWSNAT
ncbi:MAG: hypothetical protein ABIV25_07995, partial [Paracoccaceae bacterium]